MRSSPSLARRGPLLVSGPDRLNPRICSPSSFSAWVVSRTTQTTDSASPLLLSSIADSAFRGDTRLHKAQFALPWSTSAEWTLAPCPYLKARLWHSPLCAKSSSTDLKKRVEAHQARGERVQGSKHYPQPRSPASLTVPDADAIGPKVTEMLNPVRHRFLCSLKYLQTYRRQFRLLHCPCRAPRTPPVERTHAFVRPGLHRLGPSALIGRLRLVHA